jgi:hypothetical protein
MKHSETCFLIKSNISYVKICVYINHKNALAYTRNVSMSISCVTIDQNTDAIRGKFNVSECVTTSHIASKFEILSNKRKTVYIFHIKLYKN